MTAPSRSGAARFDSAAQEVFLGLWRTYDRLRVLEDELFATVELTAQQYNVLRLLGHAGNSAVPTLELAGRLVSRAPDITRMLDKLEQRGFIRRERDADDRRLVRVALTESGKKLIDELRVALRQCHERQLGHLSKAELKSLAELLRAARAPHEPPESIWR